MKMSTKNKTGFALLLISILVFPIGCKSNAKEYQLNIFANSKPDRDIAPLNESMRELVYETQEINGLAVSYNLSAEHVGDIYGYALRLIFSTPERNIWK